MQFAKLSAMSAASTSFWRHIRSFLRMPRCRSPDEEAAFLHQHQAWLLHSIGALFMLSILGHAVPMFNHLRLEGQRLDHPFDWDLQDPRFASFAWWTAAVLLSVFALSSIYTTKMVQPESATRVAEYALAALSIVVNIATPLLNRRGGPTLMGADPRETWARPVDYVATSSAILVFTSIVVLSAFPIRCSVLLVHHVIVAVANVILRVRSSSSPTIATNLMVIVVTVCSFTNAYRIESFTRQSWTAMRQSQTDAEGKQWELQRQQAITDAIKSVLRVLFDVVLHMGDTFTMGGENGDFRGIFGELANPDAPGVQLTDYLTPDDRERLRNLAHHASNLNVPQLMATTLESPAGEHIQHAELFMADTRLDGEHKYLVGIRFPPLPFDNEIDRLPQDFNDQTRLGEFRAVQAAASAGIQHQDRGHIELSVQNVGPTLQSNASSVTSDSSPSRPWMPLYIQGGEVAAIINGAAPDYRISDCSASFEDLCGPNPVGQAFSAWVDNSDGFRCWLEHQVNTLSCPGDDIHDSPSINLTLRPPSGVARGMELRVRVKVAVEQSNDSSRELDEYFPVQLTLVRFRWRLIQDREQNLKSCSL